MAWLERKEILVMAPKVLFSVGAFQKDLVSKLLADLRQHSAIIRTDMTTACRKD